MDFHIGGTNSVRGWPLGSRVGKNQWLNTAEYWFRLFDDRAFRFWFIKWRMGLQLALFGDVGTAWYDGPEFGENFIAGFGGGVRLTIPVVVLLRLDVAYSEGRIRAQVRGGRLGKGDRAESRGCGDMRYTSIRTRLRARARRLTAGVPPRCCCRPRRPT